jgi:hypothetical protein
MKEKVTFETNVPVEVSLSQAEGKDLESRWGRGGDVQPGGRPRDVRAAVGAGSAQEARGQAQ